MFTIFVEELDHSLRASLLQHGLCCVSFLVSKEQPVVQFTSIVVSAATKYGVYTNKTLVRAYMVYTAPPKESAAWLHMYVLHVLRETCTSILHVLQHERVVHLQHECCMCCNMNVLHELQHECVLQHECAAHTSAVE